MMPPYTSLWLQILLEIRGTAAWLRTGEASPGSEQGVVRVVRGAPTGNSGGLHAGGEAWRWMALELCPLGSGLGDPTASCQGHSLP